MKYNLSLIRGHYLLVKLCSLILLAMLPSIVTADEISVIKQALATSHDKIEAMGSKLPAIKYLKRKGFISASPDEVYDYSDIYFPLKDIRIFGAKLVALERWTPKVGQVWG